ncbi:MAG: galactokinase family protein, partial [Bacillota bacterium]
MQDLFRPAKAWEGFLSSPEGEFALHSLYTRDAAAQRARYLRVIKGFSERFTDTSLAIVSAPGRTELSGNHTDHQRGRVLAAAVTLDIVAAVRPSESGVMRLYSEGYGEAKADIHDPALREAEKNTTAALLRGVAAGLA